jgi:hypothetical protein
MAKAYVEPVEQFMAQLTVEHARGLAARQRFDRVLSDLGLPDASGLGTAAS